MTSLSIHFRPLTLSKQPVSGWANPCADREGGGGGAGGLDPPPLKNHKNIGFLGNTGTEPWTITKLQGQHSMSGHYRPASETPFKWRSAGGPMMTRLKWYLNASSPHKKNIVRVSSDPL